MNCLCDQLFYRKHLSSSVKRRKAPWSPDTQQYAHLNSAVPCDSAGRRVCHWDPTQVIRILFKYVFTEPTHTSHSYSQALEITDHLPYSAFLDALLTLLHVLFCSPLDVFCSCLYLYQTRAAAQMKMLCLRGYW